MRSLIDIQELSKEEINELIAVASDIIDNGAKYSEACKGKNNPNYGKLGAKNPKSISVVQLTLDGELVNIYCSAIEAERECGFNHGHINSCCKGRLKTHKGYKWQYLHEVD